MRRYSWFNIDWMLVVPVIILLGLSLSTLFSINVSYFKNQSIFLLISIAAFILFSNVDYKILQLYAKPIYIASLVLLALVLLMGIESRGAVRWLAFLGLRIQFSEILKPFLAISLAAFLTQKQEISLKVFLIAVGLLLPLAFLIFLQPDLGNALIYSGVFILTLIYFGLPWRFMIGSLVVFLLSLPVIWKTLHTYQKQRILTFFNPGRNVLSSSYNSVQAIIAIGSGLFFGKGFGMGTQSQLRFLPERQTDFIFATIAEQIGFLGSLIILFAFGLLFYKIFKISRDSSDSFAKTFSIIALFLLLVQFFMNVGMNAGALPIVGVTLPFVSYGGSSLLSSFIFLGILSSISRDVHSRKVIEIK